MKTKTKKFFSKSEVKYQRLYRHIRGYDEKHNIKKPLFSILFVEICVIMVVKEVIRET